MSSTSAASGNGSSSPAWVRTITTPFRKARTKLFNPHGKDSKKPRESSMGGADAAAAAYDAILQGEVMACGYEDVRVMWSMLDKSRPQVCNTGS